MSTVMPGLIVNNPPTITTTIAEEQAHSMLGLASGSAGGLSSLETADTRQFRKEVGNLKVSFDDGRYDSGIDSFKESDLQALRDEEEEDETEEYIRCSNSTSVTEKFSNLEINEQIDEDVECCSSVCQCLTEDAFNQDEEGDTPLHSSIIYGRPAYAHKFISCAPRLEYLSIQNKLRQTPMHLAVILKQHEVVRQLVVAGANLEVQDHNGHTALHIACKYNDIDSVRELTTPITDQERYKWPGRFFEQAIPQNLELQNFEGYTCFHLAAFAGDNELLSYLATIGCSVNARDGKSGRTALHHAVEQGKTSLIKYLVYSLHADVDVLTFDHCTPLHLAVSRGFDEAIAVLMDANADRSITNSEGLRADQLHSYKSQFCN